MVTMEAHGSTLSAGTLFAGRYRIERALGEGGMGKVYLAKDTMLGDEPIAIKILHGELSRDEKHSQRFLREVLLSRKLTHANVVKTFDAGEVDGMLYLSMEYVEGIPLKDRIAAGNLGWVETAKILRDICLGLSAVHEANIIHRDLKPGNVMLTKDGRVKIGDFGVARPGVSELTSHDEIIGCAPYIAPEVWLGKRVGPFADLYAVGVIAYEMLTGELPFDADSPAELMRKHLSAKPYPPREITDSIPVWLSNLTLSLLEKDPKGRPQSSLTIASEIDRELKAHADGNLTDLSGNTTLEAGLISALKGIEARIPTPIPTLQSPVQPPVQPQSEIVKTPTNSGSGTTSHPGTTYNIPKIIPDRSHIEKGLQAPIRVARQRKGTTESIAAHIKQKHAPLAPHQAEESRSWASIIGQLFCAAVITGVAGGLLIVRGDFVLGGGSAVAAAFLAAKVLALCAILAAPVALVTVLSCRKCFVETSFRAWARATLNTLILCLLIFALELISFFAFKDPAISLSFDKAQGFAGESGKAIFSIALLSIDGSIYPWQALYSGGVSPPSWLSPSLSRFIYIAALCGFVLAQAKLMARHIFRESRITARKFQRRLVMLVFALLVCGSYFREQLGGIFGVTVGSVRTIRVSWLEIATSNLSLRVGLASWGVILLFSLAYSYWSRRPKKRLFEGF